MKFHRDSRSERRTRPVDGPHAFYRGRDCGEGRPRLPKRPVLSLTRRPDPVIRSQRSNKGRPRSMLSTASASLRYLGRVWDCRYFWLSLVRMDLRNRYRRSTLWMGWSLLNPLLMTGILCAVFGAWF